MTDPQWWVVAIVVGISMLAGAVIMLWLLQRAERRNWR